MSYCFVHAADLHLDTPFSGLGEVDPGLRSLLRDASLNAWDALVELTISRGAAFLLLAGDIYDGADRAIRAQFRFHDGLLRLSDAGVLTFIVHGNHDPLEGWSALSDIQAWPEGVTIFGADQVQSVPVRRDGRILATVHGISYAAREVRENLSLGFKRGPEPGLHVGLLHCNAGSHQDHASFAPCSLADLEAAGLDYWALGHIHRQQILKAGYPWIVYPGNLQGRSPKPSELGPKGALVVPVEAGQLIGEPEFVALDQVRFERLAVDVSTLADLGALKEALLGQAQEVQDHYQMRPLLLRAAIEGRGDLHSLLLRPGAVDELLSELRAHGRQGPSWRWWDAIEDRTRPALERDALSRREDFSGMLAKMGLAELSDPNRQADLLAGACSELERPAIASALNGLLEPLDAQDCLDRALDLALDLLDRAAP